MYEVVATNRFKKDLKLAIKRGLDISLLDEIVTTLQNGKVDFHPKFQKLE